MRLLIPAAGVQSALAKEGTPYAAPLSTFLARNGASSPHGPPPNLAITRNLSTGQNTPQVPSFYPSFIGSLKEHKTHVGLCQDQQHQASFVYELTPSSRTDFHEWSPCCLHCKALKSGKERTTLGPRKSQASGSPIICFYFADFLGDYPGGIFLEDLANVSRLGLA